MNVFSKRRLALAYLLGAVIASRGIAEVSTRIRLDTVGYLPTHEKKASVAAPRTGFSIVRVSDGKEVFAGVLRVQVHNSDTDEDIRVADFSTVREPGEYRLEVEGIGESAPFRIAEDAYEKAFVTVTRAMYLWRCGCAVSGTHDGMTFHHDACHTEDAWLDLVTGENVRKDFTGGWHDAGDYNKYVVNAGVTLGAMLRAWEDFGPRVRRVALDLPERGGALPEFLAEIKWETDWLLKMQAEDGSAYHKVSTKSFGGFILPEKETTPRYACAWGTPATGNFVAMLAAASRVFRPFDREYAERCLAAAKKSYAFLVAHPEEHLADQTAFRTGGYQAPDRDPRLWAAAEIWEATGSADALADVEARLQAAAVAVDENFDWGNPKNLGVFTYLFSQRDGRDAQLVARLRETLITVADAIVAKRNAHGYARPLGTHYNWGCNGSVARQTMVLQAAHRVAPKPEYIETALDAVHHLFGRNVHGRSYVTGIGSLPPLHPHDRRVGGNGVPAAWPGYLVGGPNPKAADWHDEQADFRTNEIAINWNGALIYALAGFLPPQNEE